MKKIKLFVDMDGVLAEQKENMVYLMYNQGYFLNLPPMPTMINLVKTLIKMDIFEIYILSTVISSPYCVLEKGLWLDKYLPEIKKDNRLFVPKGTIKSTFAQDNVDTEGFINVILDDFTENLVNWTLPGGVPIKVLNGQNNTKGTWVNNDGHCINAYDDIDTNVNMIHKIILGLEGVIVNGFIELSKQGQQEYKQTMDVMCESVGINIFDI